MVFLMSHEVAIITRSPNSRQLQIVPFVQQLHFCREIEGPLAMRNAAQTSPNSPQGTRGRLYVRNDRHGLLFMLHSSN